MTSLFPQKVQLYAYMEPSCFTLGLEFFGHIYISIKTALNDAMNGKFMVKLDHYNRTR